ncbi:hypothetical protein GCK72_000345 [Caenorhabditis remanei]|uniref:SXP/RAL-2 family protein Ani s 5-like cation-binding domain-containing protein n=1 Tax=Caenorhabditis remanei TaxID=31234 RepID=A0A6A5HQK0_CAERE|nr:hypothetical protein GCK72_000345 [Caenorhabditis remanei]KAF1768533.1 hypothetical protein GCK72_000345 [Caenorhabditis remanei]
MKTPAIFILLFPLFALSELHDYEDQRALTPVEYRDQFDWIVDDLSVTEEETNRKLIVLATHFHEEHTFRRGFLANKAVENQLYNSFLEATQRIKTAKYKAQEILANRTQSAQVQYDAAVYLDKKFPLEMSVLLNICKTMGYKNTKSVIASSLKDAPKTKKLAEDLEKYTVEAHEQGYLIAQMLNDLPFVSRKSRMEERKKLVEQFPKAMIVYEFVMKSLTTKMTSVLDG